ncbi:Caffeic acid 3-O-methyltransferase [Platanthera zijinensis]|uniref:Caffeic acid 3-O-methyltransferase n=1 Tax=Platanthera zijinensis TaxID=2320716 RepID=A0AAP0GG17_9ASPA
MAALHLRGSHVLSMVTKAAIKLRLFDVLAAAGPDTELTAGEITGKLHLKRSNEKGASMLDLMLGFLAAHSILTCTSAAAGGDRRKTYGLTATGRLMANDEDAMSMAPILLLTFHEDMIAARRCLKEAVREGVNPFRKAHGDESLYEYLEKNPELEKLFNQAMENQSNLVMNNITKKYKEGFMEIKELLVDVGGGTGATLSTIVSNFAHIKGINFDLPRVISQAPFIPGVEHIGGDMFDMIPSGGTILLKWILHNWNDEQYLAILKNCPRALPAFRKSDRRGIHTSRSF